VQVLPEEEEYLVEDGWKWKVQWYMKRWYKKSFNKNSGFALSLHVWKRD
jgi:hypothetical protein